MIAAGAKSSRVARIAAALMAGAYLFFAATDPARAQSQSAQRPAPTAQRAKPGKPASPAKPKPSSQPATPLATATPAPKARDNLPPQPQPPLDTSQPPPTLPRASREKMRACAEEWEKMKRATKVHLPMWRDFATGCLTR